MSHAGREIDRTVRHEGRAPAPEGKGGTGKVKPVRIDLMRRNTTRFKNDSRRGRGATLSAALLASMIMTGSASAYTYSTDTVIAPNTAHPDEIVELTNGAVLTSLDGDGSLEAGLGYDLENGTIDGVSLNDGLVGGVSVAANLVKEGYSDVTLIGDSYYTGATIINHGSLILGDGERGANLHGTSGVQIGDDGTLILDIGNNTFSLATGAAITGGGVIQVNTDAGKTSSISDVAVAGGTESVLFVLGSGTTALVNTQVSVAGHLLDAGTELIDAGSFIHADTIMIGNSGSAILEVDGGSVANQDGTGRSDIMMEHRDSEIRISNGGSVLGDISTLASGVKLTVTDADSRFHGDILFVNGSVSVSSGATLTGGWDDYVSILTLGDVTVENGGRIATGSVYLENGDLDVSDDSSVFTRRSITIQEGNLTASGGSSVRANRDIYLGNGNVVARGNSHISAGDDILLENGNIMAARSSIRARGDMAIADGNILAYRSSIRAGDDISIENGNLIANRSTVRAGDDITLADGYIDANRSIIRAGGNIFIDSGSLRLVDSSLLAGQSRWGRGSVRVEGNVYLDNSVLEGDRFSSSSGDVDVLNGSTINARTTINDGLLTVDETSTIIGRTTIRGGAAAGVEGIIDGSVVLRDGTGDFDGGVLFGHNVTITGNLVNNGIVAPGVEYGSVGTIYVGGDFYQGPDGTYAVNIQDKNHYSQILVAGSATIHGGDVYINRNGYKPHRNDTLRIIDTLGGVEVLDGYTVHHNFATNTMLEAQVRYSADAVEVFIDQLKFTGQAKTPNQHAVARALDHAAKRGQLDGLFDHLNYTDRSNVPRLLQLLSPEALTAIFDVGFANSQIQNVNIERRLDDVRNGSRGFSANGLALSNNRGTVNYDGAPIVNDRDGLSLAGFDGKTVVSKEVVAPVIEENRWGFFVTGSGEWADVNSTHDATGADFTSGGVTVGADYRVNDNFVVGLFGGYVHTKTDIDDDGGNIKANGGRGGLYGSYYNEGLYVNALASGGYNSYKIDRKTIGGTARGDTDGGQFDSLLGAGYDFSLGCVTLGPVGSLQYSYVGFDRFEESGSDARQTVQKNSQDSLRTLVGAKAAACWNVGGMALRPEVRAQWKHEYLDRAGAIDSSFTGSGALFTVYGPQIGRDSLVIDAGASLDVSETVSIYAYYTGELARENYSSNSVNGGFRLSF